MSFFRKFQLKATVTCEDVVAAFSEVVQKQPSGGDASLLPFDPELIKAALIETSARSGTPEACDAGKTGFALLNLFVGGAMKLDLTVVDEDSAHALLDRELDSLEAEFDARLAMARSLIHA